MKILFIDVYTGIHPWGIYYNPGVASIAAVLEHNGHSPELFAIFTRKDIDTLVEHIKSEKISVVGFTVTEPTLDSVGDVARKIKAIFPNIFILCGGLNAILDPDSIFKKVPCDAVCVGEGENPTLELVTKLESKSPDLHKVNNFWFRDGKKIIKNPLSSPVNLNNLPKPNRKIFYNHNLDVYRGNIYLKPDENGCVVTISRGCYFNCSFCGNWFQNTQYHGNYRRVLTPKNAVDQLVDCIKGRSYDYMIFIDAQFPTDNDWLESFATLYKKKVKIPFTIQLRFGSFNDRTVELLKEAGCYFVQIGLESGDKDIRFKVLNKRVDHQMIIDGVGMFKKRQIGIGLNNMIGLPNETPENFINTIRTNALLYVGYSYLFIYYPYKGTELYKYCLEHHLLKKQTKNFFLKDNTMLRLKYFRKHDILFYFKRFHLLVALYKKYIDSRRSKPIWITLFNIYSICPSERHGLLKVFISKTEKFFFKKIPKYI